MAEWIRSAAIAASTATIPLASAGRARLICSDDSRGLDIVRVSHPDGAFGWMALRSYPMSTAVLSGTMARRTVDAPIAGGCRSAGDGLVCCLTHNVLTATGADSGCPGLP